MIHSEGIRQKAQEENNQKLWEVLEAYKNDAEGLNRYQLAELAEFNMAEELTPYDIFTRAMKVCKRRAKKIGMFIPHATPSGKNGYVYYLTDRPELALPGFIASERVSAGMQKATYEHQKFIQKDTSGLSSMERVLFNEVSRISDERHREREDHLQERFDMLQKMHDAVEEDRKQKESTPV